MHGVSTMCRMLCSRWSACVSGYFQASVVNGAVSILKSEALVRRARCPRIAFPTASVASRLPILDWSARDNCARHRPRLDLAARVSPAARHGVADVPDDRCRWLVSAFAVHYRDTLNAVPLIVQAGSFLAPIGYSASQLSPALRTLVDLDPITGLVEFWRWLLIGAAFPGPLPFTASIIGTGLAVILGWHIFSRCEVTMADVI